MASQWTYRLLFLTAFSLAIVVGALLVDRVGTNAPATTSQAGLVADPPVMGQVLSSCLLDPASLPPPPPGPDGRPSNYLHTCGSRIYDARGEQVRITGLNWNGMETGDHVPGGLGDRKWQELLDLVASLGYNTIRLPFSNEALQADQQVKNVNFTLNPDLQGKTPLEVLDLLIAGARERGLKVILDRHWPTPHDQTPLWYTMEVPEERWLADWRTLAARYAGDDTVIGVDLSNEPRGPATWGSGDPATDWRMAAERAGNAVLEANPYLLVLVEGIESYNGERAWWGGDLQGVRTAPVRLRVPNRVVYSPHDYGPSVYNQGWFQDPLFPGNLPEVWDRRWGYIQQEGLAPVVLGEFGGRSVGDDRDGQWQRVLLAYLRRYEIGALVWSLNPNWDTGGIVASDWQTVEAEKQGMYREILAAPLDTGATGVFGRAPTRLKVLFHQGPIDGQTGSASFAFQIVNDGPMELPLSRFELRYWLRTGDSGAREQQVVVEAAEPVGLHALADLAPTSRSDQDRYLRVSFAPKAGTVGRYRASEKVTVRFSTTDWPISSRAGDYSFAGALTQPERFGEWDRVTLYLDGELVWGREP